LDSILIHGGRRLAGRIRISGAKNAALPLMTASLLTDEPLRLSNLPDLLDITTLAELLAELGVTVDNESAGALSLRADRLTGDVAPYNLVRKMRASVLVLGPLLARHGEARVSLPGGCAIGTRPIDLHIAALEQLGAEITLEDGYVHARAPGGLKGATVRFAAVSVGATENLLMAACLAEGETVLENAAREPEIDDLARCLGAMGAKIEGVGSERLTITGVERLGGASHAVLPDRIEAGTYAVAAAITHGDILLEGAQAQTLGAVIEALGRAGVSVSETADGLRVRHDGGLFQPVDVLTAPFPGFPTDMQAQFMALMCFCDGAAMITENIFENRFMHVPELARMGADITVHGASALVRGAGGLTGAPVMATDLRASVSLVLAGLAASGQTRVNRVYHLDRGYERLEQKLAACGADIERLAG
jgi:UDP-N-acetylglucosamine 1-carboxyvinyltransferase